MKIDVEAITKSFIKKVKADKKYTGIFNMEKDKPVFYIKQEITEDMLNDLTTMELSKFIANRLYNSLHTKDGINHFDLDTIDIKYHIDDKTMEMEIYIYDKYNKDIELENISK